MRFVCALCVLHGSDEGAEVEDVRSLKARLFQFSLRPGGWKNVSGQGSSANNEGSD